MNGAAIRTPGVAVPAIPPNANAASSSFSEVNSLRISVVAERLAMYAQPNNSSDVAYFFNLCISLSRGIDYSIANNEIPAQVSKLPPIFKLVCQRREESSLLAAIMVLMVTVKHACKAQWFSSKETQELLTLADEVSRIFNTPDGISCDQTNDIPAVSQIMTRYYPRLKLGRILASVDIKPGFEACAVDFHISKNMNCLTWERIRLLVATKDNIDTSSCIISPSKVNILLNGKGVLGRMVGCMDLGPQLPTIVNPMLRYGTNLLQAVGHFDAHYIVLIAFMSVIPSSSLPAPEDYVQPVNTAVDSDAEVIEGPSRISLNCPISFTCIRKPVKGKLCKHLQCFDLSNYIEINSKRPSWRCPHCNQSVCYPDIRIDKKMWKILQEVAEGVVNVIIHSDGSWEATSGSNDSNEESHAKASEGLQEGPEQQAASSLPNGTSNVYDLTEGDDEMIISDGHVSEDTKPDLQSTSIYMNHCVPPVAGDPSETNQTSGTLVQGPPCSAPSGIFCGPGDHNTRTNSEPVGGISARMFGNFTPSPVLTDSISSVANREQQACLGTNQQSSPLSSVWPPATNILQLQQAQRGQMLSNEFGGYAIPRNVSRTPSAIQALPVQMPRPNPVMSSRPVVNNLSGNTSSLPSRTSLPPPSVSINASTIRRDSPAVSVNASTIRRESPAVPVNASATRRDSVQQLYISQSQLQQHSPAQVRGLVAPIQGSSNAFRATSGLQAAHQPLPTNQMPPQMVCTPPHLRARTQFPPGGSVSSMNQTATTGQHYQHMAAAAPQAASRPRQPPTTPIQIQTSRPWSASMPRPADGLRHVMADRVPTSGSAGMVQTVSRTQDLLDTQSEQNWRPTGRMRGSLSGRAYSDALNQLMIRPTQTTPAPPGQSSNLNMSPQLQVLLANRNLHSSQPNPSRNNS